MKHIIYSLFENCFSSCLTLGDLQLKLKDKRDIPRFINWIFGCYVSFKIFDLLEILKDKLNDLYLNIGNTPIIFNREKYHSRIEAILQNPRVDLLFNYIACNKENDVTLNKRTPSIQKITYALKTVGLSYTAGKNIPAYSWKEKIILKLNN